MQESSVLRRLSQPQELQPRALTAASGISDEFQADVIFGL